jgi:hypothetical protein
MMIMDTQISELRAEAADAGDRAQVELCDLALDGDDAARASCAEVIADAEAANPCLATVLRVIERSD